MSQNEMIMLIAGISGAACLLLDVVRRPLHGVFMLIRGVFFILLLYAVQLTGLWLGWEHVVAVNLMTALVSAFLGVPGILFLYALHFIL